MKAVRDNLRAMLAAGTPGPWTWLPGDKPSPGFRFGGEGAEWEAGYAISAHDAALLVAAVNALPVLFDDLDAAENALREMRLRLSNMCDAAEWLGDPNTSVRADAKLRSLLRTTATSREALARLSSVEGSREADRPDGPSCMDGEGAVCGECADCRDDEDGEQESVKHCSFCGVPSERDLCPTCWRAECSQQGGE